MKYSVYIEDKDGTSSTDKIDGKWSLVWVIFRLISKHKTTKKITITII